MKKLVFILLSISLFACDKKKNTVKPDLGSILPCFEQTNWDIQKLNSYLSGTWQMNRAFGGWVGEMNVENVKLKFLNKDSIIIYKNGALLLTSKYHIDSTGNNNYSLVADSSSQYTAGRVMYCTNEIVFNSSFVDGIDYYFAKVSN